MVELKDQILERAPKNSEKKICFNDYNVIMLFLKIIHHIKIFKREDNLWQL